MSRPATGRRVRVCAAFTIGCLMPVLGLASDAAAQQDSFVDALIAFRTSLAGAYGDEGPQVTASLDRLARSLDVWDGGLASAEADLRAALEGAPADRALHVRATLASLFIERGRLTEALAEMDAAIALDSGRHTSHVLRGVIAEAAGARTEAFDEYRRAWALGSTDPLASYLYADRGLTLGLLDDPTAQIAVLLDAADNPPQQRIGFIETLLVDDYAADWPVFAPAAYAEGFAFIAEGRHADAVASFRAAAAQDPLVIDPTSRSAPMVAGLAHLREFRLAAAIEQLAAAVASAPGSSEAQRMLATAYATDGRDADAIRHFEAAIRIAPRDERSRVALGGALMRERRWEEAERALLETIALLPQSGDARWVLAHLYNRRVRDLDAIHVLEAATALPMLAGRGQLYWRLAQIAHGHLDFDRVALALAERARLHPNNPAVYKDLGLAHMRRGASQHALLALLMAALIGPEDAETLAAIGQIHFESGDYTRAEPLLRRAVTLAPALSNARFALGTTLVRLGRAEEGRAHLAEFQQLNAAELDKVRRALALTTLIGDADRHTDQGRHGDSAEVWAQVVALEPEDPTHRLALADALARAGRLEEAVSQMEMAAAMNADAFVHRRLAFLYDQLGRADDRARAQATFERLRREQGVPGPAR